MLSLDPIVDNSESTLEETFKKVVPLSEEIRISTGYFYLSGFDLISEDLEQLAHPETLGHAPMRVLMGRRTDRQTADEIEEDFTLRDQFKRELQEDIGELNRAQIERLDRLRDFIANGLLDVRVRVPEDGYFHAKGACFRGPPGSEEARNQDEDKRAAVTIVGSSNFSASGQRRNVELNMTSQERPVAEGFEEWFDNQWANAEPFSQEIIEIIERSDKYQECRENQRTEDEDEDEAELGTYLEPFELFVECLDDALCVVEIAVDCGR